MRHVRYERCITASGMRLKYTRVRAVHPANDSGQFVSEKRLREFGAEIKSCVGKKIDALALSLMQPKEKLADYIADIKKLVIKGNPTADAKTRERINVRHFLKGLTDQQTPRNQPLV